MTSPPPTNRAPPDFSQQEWLALFPWPAKDPGVGLPAEDDEDALPDASEPPREAEPLDAHTLAAALAPWPHLRGLARLQRSSAVQSAVHAKLWRALRLLAFAAASCALLSFVPSASGGQFGTKQTAAFGAAFVGLLLALNVAVFRKVPWTEMAWSYDADPLAGFVRWCELVEADRAMGKDGAAGSVLLRHWDSDEKCPCATCLADLGHSILRQFTWIIALRFVVGGFATWLLAFWTPLVTLGSAVWSSPWAVAGLVLVVHIVTFYPLNAFARNTRCSGAMTPTLRLLRRAVAANLMSVLDACRGTPGADGDYSRHVDLMIQLRRRLAAAATVRLSALEDMSRIWLVTSLSYVVSMIIVAAVGSCITAGSISTFGFLFCVSCFDIYLSAYANGLASDAGKLYDAALVRLRERRARDPEGQAIDHAHEQRIVRVEGLLRSYRDVAGLQATFFGFPITFRVVRTLLVTTFTVAIGLWSLLRSAGLTFTIESICPSW